MSAAPPPLFTASGGPAVRANAAWVEGADGVRLRSVLFPHPTPRGTAILSTGRTEFIEKYAEVIGELMARGFTVLTHDWRGQGLSDRLILGEPLKGHARGVDPFLDDLARVVAGHQAELPRPWIAVGHSMGGALTLAAVAEGRLRVDALVLSAPMIAVCTGATPLWLAGLAAGLLARMGRTRAYAQAPSEPLDDPFDGNPLTHDRRRWERTQALLLDHPELRLGQVTWGWVVFAFALAARLRRSASRLPAPLWIVAAGDDRLVETAAAKAYCARVPDARWEAVPGALHEILMESDPIRAVFWAAFDEADAALPR